MCTFYRWLAGSVKGGIGKTIWSFALLGVLFILVGCTGVIFGPPRSPPPPPPVGAFTVNAPVEVVTDENGPGIMVALPYQATEGLTAAYCVVNSLEKVEWTTRCFCVEGACRVGIRASQDASGEGSFEFSFRDGAHRARSGLGKAKVIIREVTVEASKNLEEAPVATEVPLEVLVKNVGTEKYSGNLPVSGVEVSWNVIRGGGKISSCTEKSNEKGLVNCKWTLGTKVAEQELEASIFGNKKKVNFKVKALAGPAAKLAFGNYPRKGIAGDELSTEVLVQDIHGNNVTDFRDTVSLALNKPEGSLDGTYTGEAISGKASLKPKIKKVGQYVLKASSASGLEKAVGQELDISSGKAHHLAFILQPEGGKAGSSTLARQPEVAVEDANNNRALSAFTTVEVSLIPPSGGEKTPGKLWVAGRTIEGTSASIETVEGVAAFKDLSAGGPIGNGYKLEAKSQGLEPATSAPFSIAHGKPHKLVFTQQPSDGQVKVPLEKQPELIIKDDFGNVATSATDEVLLLPYHVIVSGGWLEIDRIEKETSGAKSPAKNGVVSFTKFAINEKGVYVLKAVSTGLVWAGGDLSQKLSIK